jgi:peptidoglycan/LPS O-acetylase OafA/YrhL
MPKAPRFMAAMGRWSLSYYMLHQPALIGLVAGLVWLIG